MAGLYADSGPKGARPIEIRDVGVVSIGFLLALVTALILLTFYSWLSYQVAISLMDQQTRESTIIHQCAPGECVVDRTTGEKICPDGITAYAYNPEYQTCSSQTICTDPINKFAMTSDGSTNNLGTCDVDPTSGNKTTCRCLRNASCSFFITAIFEVISGNAFTGIVNSRTVFQQQIGPNYSSYGITGDRDQSIGMTLSNPSAQFCQVASPWIYRTSPGCSAVLGANNDLEGEQKLAADMIDCFDLKPCLNGTLAFITDDSSTFNYNQINSVPIGCVSGEGCPSGELAIYDTSYGGVVCYPCDSSVVGDAFCNKYQ